MYRLTKEHARRTVQLRNNYTLGTVYDKRASWRHVRDISKEHILNDGLEIYVLLVITAQTEFGFQGNGVSKSALHTLVNGVAGRINEII